MGRAGPGLRRSATFVRMKTKPLIWSAGCLSASLHERCDLICPDLPKVL
jgi:hypothetical protein